LQASVVKRYDIDLTSTRTTNNTTKREQNYKDDHEEDTTDTAHLYYRKIPLSTAGGTAEWTYNSIIHK
jgi:hypothetical protein